VALQAAVLKQLATRQGRRQVERQLTPTLSVGKTSTNITVTIPKSNDGNAKPTVNRHKPKGNRRFVLSGIQKQKKG